MITTGTYWSERTLVKVAALVGWDDPSMMDRVVVRKLKGTLTRSCVPEDLRKLSPLEALAATMVDWPVSPVEPD